MDLVNECHLLNMLHYFSESSEMSYQLILDVLNQDACVGIENQDMCDGVEGLSEAIEFSMRNDIHDHWIPLRLTYHNIDIDDIRKTDVRGYKTAVHIESSPITTDQRVNICGDMLLTRELRFRWVGTVNCDRSLTHRTDMWALASVNATLITQDENISLIQDNFGGNTLK